MLLGTKDEEKEALLNLVIVGAGPTGVELSGAFAEIKKNPHPLNHNKALKAFCALLNKLKDIIK